MNSTPASTNRKTWQHFTHAIESLWSSKAGAKAKALFALLVALIFVINGLNVLNSYVGRDFISALETRDMSRFMRQSGLYVLVFGLSTVVAVSYRYLEEMLGLLWREWQTRHLLGHYLEHRVYHELAVSGGVENPDQRIAEDVRAFTTMTLSFLLMTLNASFTVVAFSGVLWSISPLLFWMAVAYALAGSFVTILLGRRLVGLNSAQLDREASFRSALVHLAENSGAVAILRREEHLKSRLLRRLDDLVGNARRVIAVNRSLGFFTTGYNYLIPIIPVFAVAHLFIWENIEFGVVTQSAMAFTQLMGAFSLIVTQFQSISSYAAVSARLGLLSEGIEGAGTAHSSPLEICERSGLVAYEDLTLHLGDGKTLISRLTISIPRGVRVLIRASNGFAKVALFEATAGLFHHGEGRIVRPGADQMLFLLEHPYLPKGTLREMLARTSQSAPATDDEIEDALKTVGVESLPGKAGGLDTEQDWNALLSPNEQALLEVARVLLAAPEFVFLDRLLGLLDPAEVGRVYRAFQSKHISYIVLGRADDDLAFFDRVLSISQDGSWQWK